MCVPALALSMISICYIEGYTYVQKDFIKGLILSVRSLLPVEPLVEECEKRYVLCMLNWLYLCAYCVRGHSYVVS
ncbi:hypothetical protein L1987_58010 [Smallanthus sonchifolius]|uniref:Uncharacterized protein n=1 Tax=Smallanthus sonchifolius TaxID=185202 RepID=A0ACB9DF47_9ASTR|nr:hypothetical protein L1987_58010 [Smallanthus sonchifolius]